MLRRPNKGERQDVIEEIDTTLHDLRATNIFGPQASRILSVIRDAPLYRPDLVLAVGIIARRFISALTPAHWDTTEQMALSAADLGAWPTYDHLVSVIEARFPGSLRVSMIHARAAEARCEWNIALDMYGKMLEKDPHRRDPYKRQVAVFKAMGKFPEATAMLNQYLKHFADDGDAWAELCAICLRCGRYEQGLYAANEVLLLDPNNFAAHCLVADVFATIGGCENVLAARRHYAASLACKPRGNTRALFGIWNAAMALKDENTMNCTRYARDNSDVSVDPGDSSSFQSDNEHVISWAATALRTMYSGPACVSRNEHDIVSKTLDAISFHPLNVKQDRAL